MSAGDPLGRLVGIDYAEGGRSIESGLDCYGVVRLAMAELGVDMPERYADALIGEARAQQVAIADADRGDLVVMEADSSSGFGLHVGVMVDPLRFLHATRLGGSRLDCLELWRRAGKVRRLVRIQREGE